MAPPIHSTDNPWDSDFRGYTQIIDVRSPAEFAEDHIPGAVNFPVLSNEERAIVGTIYKQRSPFEARKIGAALVSKNIGHHLEHHFLDQPKTFHPLIYCWRGGQRSNSFATVLSQIGWQTTLLTGGYKTYRDYVRQSLDELGQNLSLRILCGYTGSAKTKLLQALHQEHFQVLDLEAIACHRGSLLGQMWTETPQAQPSQKWFESQLLAKLKTFDPARPIWVESESKTVGNVHLPKTLWENMGRSPVVEVALPLAERVELLMAEYPHLIEQPAILKQLLGHLSAKYGKRKIQAWYDLIDGQQWPEFVSAILQEHYDPTYRQSLPRHFQMPQKTILLENLAPQSIKRFIEAIACFEP
ncbi:tRNA 2-selenouridine(34) synthase MnmH [Picosynechococcus sp. NKBG15041c]|uniref:tRNA 2-selenouridine(34) synthase MnmH n=1 Tax=Picosynechococcus sp. NKBG15041c TaxID=1407650 RepID=UPI00040EF18F|nr:tRNA 2-selenouridine(34) synthase MnmH [Picosynechococcus sp. NKBG15041c]